MEKLKLALLFCDSEFVVWRDDVLCDGVKDPPWTSTAHFADCTQVLMYPDYFQSLYLLVFTT